MVQNIPNIYHFFYNDNFSEYNYYSIKSVIEINKPEKIYFNYVNLPNGIFWDKIKDNLILKKISNINKIVIYESLINYGGIYIDINSICIDILTNINITSFIKSENNEIICCEKNSPIANKYLEIYTSDNNLIDSIIPDHPIYNLNYDMSYMYFKEIYDYSFGTYFHLVKNCKFICFSSFPDNEQFDLNKITIYNLLVRNVLGYNLINISDNQLIANRTLTKLINNIDYIYWINLESSEMRRNKMIKILDNFSDIKNIRICAIDGNSEKDIHTKYFHCNDKSYPKYSNKEYAILLSHLNTIYKYANTYDGINYGVGLILEDDLSLDFINYWEKDIKTITDEAPCDWEIIMLGYFSLNLDRKETYQKWNNEWSAIAYLVNHENIQRICKFKNNGKWICNENDLMVSDNYIFSKFNTYVYNKPYFTFPNDNDSTFHADHLDYHRIYKICNYITIDHCRQD